MTQEPDPIASRGVQKKVDESWKDAVEKERITVSKAAPAADQNFSMLVSSLGMQAMAALGEAPDPSGRMQEHMDLEQARYLIDTLSMLQSKTRGNLHPDETRMLEGLLYELRVKFVDRTKAVS